MDFLQRAIGRGFFLDGDVDHSGNETGCSEQICIRIFSFVQIIHHNRPSSTVSTTM